MGLTENRWTEEEDEILTENYRKISMDDICKLFPDRSRRSIIDRARLKGITRKKSPARKWTDNEVEILRDNYKEMSTSELSKLIGRSSSSIWVKLNTLNLLSAKKSIPHNMYTDTELGIIKNYYNEISINKLSEMIPNHTIDSIRTTAKAIFKDEYSKSLSDKETNMTNCSDKYAKYKYVLSEGIDPSKVPESILKTALENHWKVITIEVDGAPFYCLNIPGTGTRESMTNKPKSDLSTDKLRGLLSELGDVADKMNDAIRDESVDDTPANNKPSKLGIFTRIRLKLFKRNVSTNI
jgi:hypothetical protein